MEIVVDKPSNCPFHQEDDLCWLPEMFYKGICDDLDDIPVDCPLLKKRIRVKKKTRINQKQERETLAIEELKNPITIIELSKKIKLSIGRTRRLVKKLEAKVVKILPNPGGGKGIYVYQINEEAKDLLIAKDKERILDLLLKEGGGPLTAREITKKTGLTRDMVYLRLPQLEKEGKIYYNRRTSAGRLWYLGRLHAK